MNNPRSNNLAPHETAPHIKLSDGMGVLRIPNSDIVAFHFGTYEVVSESSPTVIFVTASVKEDEKGGQGHTSTSNDLHE
jgi:hypothetical protein